MDGLRKVMPRTDPDKLRGIADMSAEDFFRFYERPVVLPYIVGFAGLDPCRRPGGESIPDIIAVDGGNIGPVFPLGQTLVVEPSRKRSSGVRPISAADGFGQVFSLSSHA